MDTKRFMEIWKSDKKEYSYMIYNSDGISIIAVDSEDDAKFLVEYMTKYHNREFYWKERVDL